MTRQPLTPAAERKRQQRARAAAGQVHRVAVYLTDEEAADLRDIAAVMGVDEPTALRRLVNIDQMPGE